MKRRRRSSGQSKLISKIHQLAETFKKMRMSVRDTEERLVSNLDPQFQLSPDIQRILEIFSEIKI